jgi:Mn2+/Fe2+ NRAMP family transporter
MYGLPAAVTVLSASGLLGVVVLSGTYRRVERIGVALGLFELAFLVAALRSHPSLQPITASFLTLGRNQPGYLNMVAANIGAVAMPWMVFYQQSAVVEKGLRHKDWRVGRADTALGSVVTQVVMIAVLVTAAAVLARGHTTSTGNGLASVQGIWAVLASSLGPGAGRLALECGTSVNLTIAVEVCNSLSPPVGKRRLGMDAAAGAHPSRARALGGRA